MTIRWGAAVFGALVANGCGHGPPPTPAPAAPPTPASACLIGTSGVPSPDTLTVVVPASDSAAVAAANDFDTLIRLDCEGRAIPGPASTWSRDSSGKVWTFDLPDSTGPGPLDLTATWNASDSAKMVLDASGVVSAGPAPGNKHKLVVTLSQPSPSVPAIFADHLLGVPRQRPATAIVVRTADGQDPRDLVDQSPDVLVTGDPDVLDYASSRPGTVLAQLPWDRVYVLLLAAEIRPPGALLSADSARFRGDLARDAVRADARPATPPYWWADVGSCTDSATRVPVETGGTSQVTIGYTAGDAVARMLAERIVALGDSSWFARGLAAHDFDTAIRGGAMDAYILPLPRTSLLPCRDAWWPRGATLIPLVETRRTAILRKDGPALVVGGDGSLRPDRVPDGP